MGEGIVKDPQIITICLCLRVSADGTWMMGVECFRW
jgi:hypothetical protein